MGGNFVELPLGISCNDSRITIRDRLVPAFRRIFEQHGRNEYRYNFVSYVFCVSPGNLITHKDIKNEINTSTDRIGGILHEWT